MGSLDTPPPDLGLRAAPPASHWAAWEAPGGWEGLWRVLAHVPRAIVRRPLSALARALATAALLDMALRLFLSPPGERWTRSSWILLHVFVVGVAYGVIFVRGARWVARAGIRRQPDPRDPAAGSGWPGDVGHGAALVGSCVVGACGALFLLANGRVERSASLIGLVFTSIVAFLVATLPGALTGAGWMGSAARRLVPAPRPVTFPLHLARFVLAWLLTIGCVVAVLWRASCVYRTPVAETSLVELAVGHVLPVWGVGVVIAALAEASTPRPVSARIDRVFE